MTTTTVEHCEIAVYATDYDYVVICACEAHISGDTPDQARMMLGAHITDEAVKAFKQRMPFGDPNFYSRDDETGEHTPPPVPDGIELIPVGSRGRGGTR